MQAKGRVRVKGLVFFIALMITFAGWGGIGAVNPNNEVYGADLSGSIKVTDWSIVSVNRMSELPTVKNVNEANPLDDNPDNYAIAYNRSTAKFKVDWKLTLDSGTTEEGDQFTIDPFLSDWTMLNTESDSLYDSEGKKIGTWKITSNKIVVTLSDDGIGKTEITGSCTTGENIYKNLLSPTDTVSTATIDEITKSYKVSGVDKMPRIEEYYKTVALTSNNRIKWVMDTGSIYANQLTTSNGTNIDNIGEYIIQDTFPEGTITASIGTINAYIPYVLSTTDTRTATFGGTLAEGGSVMEYFTKITQYSGESINDFKARIKPLTYGIYKDEAGLFTLIVNLGDFSDPDYLIKYKDIFGAEPGTATKDKLGTLPGETAILDKALGSTNVVNGNAVYFQVQPSTTHNKVIKDTNVTNTATASFSGTTVSSSRTATLRAVSGTAAAGEAGSVKLLKYDKTTNGVIEGTKFKLQKLNVGGNAATDADWTDYTPNDEGEKVRRTDGSGTVEFRELNNGIYRFVETEAASGYEISSAIYDNDTFTIADGDTEGKVINCSNEKTRYTVTYKPGAHGTFTDDVHGNLLLEAVTPAFTGTKDTNGKPQGDAGWVFTGWDKTVSETVKGNTIYTAQWKEKTYIVKYDLNGGSVDGNGTVSDKENVKFSDASLLYAKAPSKAGSVFTGWKLKGKTAASDPKVTDTDKYSDLAGNDNTITSITLVAVYRSNAQIGGNTSKGLSITKNLTGTPDKDEVFEFEIYDGAVTAGEAEAAPMPQQTKVYVSTAKGIDNATHVYGVTENAAKSIGFGKIEFTETGIYKYKVRENAGTNISSCTYDNTVYEVTVVVTENADKSGLETAVTYKKDIEDTESMSFTNKYKAQPADKVNVSNGVDTGDSSNIWRLLSVILLTLAAIGITLTMGYRRRSMK